MSYFEVLRKIRQAAEAEVISLDLSGLGLNRLPDEIGTVTSLQILRLDRNDLRTLPDTLADLPNLYLLSVRENQLQRLTRSLRLPSTVKLLFLGRNRFEHVPAQVWQLPDLEELDLNGIPRPQINRLAAFENLKRLHLASCQLESLPDVIYRLNRLEELDISDNRLSALSPGLLNLEALQQLNLKLNRFDDVPDVVWRMSKLRSLNLAHNRLTSLSEKVLNLAVLRSLVLANNEIEKLPDQIGTLNQLHHLYAYSLALTELPRSLSYASQLQTLWLGSNQLSAFPDNFAELEQLERLECFANRFAEFPAVVCQLPRLKELSFDSNQIASVPAAVREMGELRKLNLRNNQIAELPAEIGELASLESLDVGFNQLTALPESVGRLSRLTNLNVACNHQLTRLPVSARELTALQTLSVNGIGVEIPWRMRGDILEICHFLSRPDRDEPVINVLEEEPAVAPEPDQFGITFLDDVALLKEAEQGQNHLEPILQIDQTDFAVATDIYRYRKIEVAYFFQDSLFPLPPWVARLFLARSGRFGTDLHRLGGGTLAYESQYADLAYHVAEIDSSAAEDQLMLRVQGSFPPHFFTLLLNGLDRVVASFDQIKITRRAIYCPDPDQSGCRHRFDLDRILPALQTAESDLIVPCAGCGVGINFHHLLLGWHGRTETVTADLQSELEVILNRQAEPRPDWLKMHYQMVALRQRHYLHRFQSQQADDTTDFLRVFFLKLRYGRIEDITADYLVDQQISLSACCEQPGQWHEVGAQIPLNNDRLYLHTWLPYLRQLKEILPTIYHTEVSDFLLLEEIQCTSRLIELIPEGGLPSTEATALASLHQFWGIHFGEWRGALRKVLTPEGRYLWLCQRHAAVFD